jgi:nitric oxide reductase subunit C
MVLRWSIAAVGLATVLVLSALRGGPPAAAVGDAARGAKLYATLPCASCHDIERPWPGGDVCPNLGNIATEAARIVRLPDYRGRARDAAGYIRESILDPDAYIVPGPSYRQADGRSVMPRDLGSSLTAAQLDDLVAFLLTRR